MLLIITLMAFNSAQVLSKGATKLYHGTGSFIEVVQNQLGDTAKGFFNFCVVVQQVMLPLIYLMVIVYELNHLLFGSSTQGDAKATLYSLAIVAVPACFLSLVSYGATVMYAGMLNIFSFFTMAIILGFLFIRQIPKISNVSFSGAEM